MVQMRMQASSERLRYEIVADVIEKQIGGGLLGPHERVPSLRAMSRNLGVSVGTVVQAYVHLERRGLLHTRPRSGYFVSAAAQPPAPAPARTKRAAQKPLRIAPKVIDTVLESLQRSDLIALNSAVALAAARIDGRLNSIARRVLRESPGNPNDLVKPPGDATLRRAIAKRLATSGVTAHAEDVVITNGTMEAITLSLGMLCKTGDTVLVESPTYFGILQVIEHLRLNVVEVPNHPVYGIDVAAVESAVASGRIAAAVLQASFNNPTGAATPDDAKRRIVSILGAAGIPLVEDDIYGDLHFGLHRPKPFAAFDDTGSVISCGSVSKTVALGYRIGWAVSARHTQALMKAKFFSSVASPTLQQRILGHYYTARHPRPSLAVRAREPGRKLPPLRRGDRARVSRGNPSQQPRWRRRALGRVAARRRRRRPLRARARARHRHCAWNHLLRNRGLSELRPAQHGTDVGARGREGARNAGTARAVRRRLPWERL